MALLNLDKIAVNNNRVDYFFNIKGNLQKYFKPANNMFFEYNYDISDVPESVLTIPFIANIIPLVWITDSTIAVKELDKEFYECLDEIKASFQNMFPKIKFKGKITVEKIVNNHYIPKIKAAALFSGGLDALTTYIRIKEMKPLLITEYGWHDTTIEKSDVWEADKKNALEFAAEHNLQNILIQSNYGTFINARNIDHDFHKKLGDSWWHGLHHGLAIISAAIPVAYKLKVKCIYIASSNSPMYKVACASDPSIDNKIRYGSGQVFHDAFELTRQDKVKVVVDYCTSNNESVNIRVCFKNEENCCKCEKCMRTILGIVAEGHDPRLFGFNIPNDLSQHVRNFLNSEVKFLTDTFIIIYWKLIQQRMKENFANVLYKDLEWFLDYDFAAERKKALLKYRVTNLFPILKRKINTRLNRLFADV